MSLSREERFLAKREVLSNGCWRWMGHIEQFGYGCFWDGERRVLANRWAYEHWVGPIPTGQVLNHVCENRWCVNYDHAKITSRADNMLRGGHLNSRKTHCPAGHSYAGDNLYVLPNGWRFCRACRNIRQAKLMISSNPSVKSCVACHPIEVWRTIPGYSQYIVSNRGRLKGLAGQIMHTVRGRGGYPAITLLQSDKGPRSRKRMGVHRFVALAFIGPCPADLEVHHRDQEHNHACAKNLQYLTPDQNIREAKRRGTYYRDAHPCATLTPAIVRKVRKSNKSTYVLAKQYGVAISTMTRARGGQTWRHV